MAGAEGAYYNVLINLESLQDLDQSGEPGFVAQTRQRAEAVLTVCEEIALKTRQKVRQKLAAALDR